MNGQNLEGAQPVRSSTLANSDAEAAAVQKTPNRVTLEIIEAMVRRDLINRMSNWQRNQWGKAGSPLDIESLKQFCTMPKPQAQQ